MTDIDELIDDLVDAAKNYTEAQSWASSRVRASHELSNAKKALRAEFDGLIAALAEIEKGAGPHSQDPYEHACNVIDNMKRIAREAREGKR